MKYPKMNQKFKAIITWKNSNLNGVHIGKVSSKPFKAKSGAVLCYMDCETCNKKHVIPWTSNTKIIKFEILN